MYVDKRSQIEADDESDDESRRTIFCANLSDRVTEEILYELFIQGGPVESARIAKDKDGRQKTFGFVTYFHACSVPYALELFEGVKLFNQRVVLKPKQSNNTVKSFTSPSASKFVIQSDSRNRGDGKQFSDNSSLRMGSVNILNHKNDRNMQPKVAEDNSTVPMNPLNDLFASNSKAEDRGEETNAITHNNPFKLDVFARLGANFLVNPNLENKKSSKDKDRKNMPKHVSRNNRSSNRNYPYKRPEIPMYGDRDRGHAGRNKNSNKRRR